MPHRPAICTMSLGRCFAGHSLAYKLDMARKYGFEGIEVFYEDLIDLTSTMEGGNTPSNQLEAAYIIRDLCAARNLEIMCLQPFMHYGGLVDRDEQARQRESFELFIQVAQCLGTDLVAVPSSFLAPELVTENMNTIIEDLRDIADLCLQQSPPIRIAYEALCWGTRTDKWEGSWEIVQAVNRPNFGICFDTFNLTGRIYADPASATGRTSDAEEALVSSLITLVSTVDVKKIFLVQVASAERLTAPLDENHPFYNAEQPCRMSWSRNCRLFYGETQYGSYLPVKAVLSTIVRNLGYEGWLSFEVFNRRLTDTDKKVPEEMARRAALSWEKMAKEVPLQHEAASHRVSALL